MRRGRSWHPSWAPSTRSWAAGSALATAAGAGHAADDLAYRRVDATFHRGVLQHFLPHCRPLRLERRRHRRQIILLGRLRGHRRGLATRSDDRMLRLLDRLAVLALQG